MKNRNTKAWFGLISLAVVMGLLLFVPAGTVHYWHAWSYLLVFFGASVLITLYLMKKDPALLERSWHCQLVGYPDCMAKLRHGYTALHRQI